MPLPVAENDLDGKKRRLSSELEPNDYVQFELDAFKRGVTPYRLSSAVLTSYIRGELQEENPSPSQSSSVAGN